ncbi:unnamed protein product [Heterobilharzia americana]|nr:unnamed protein product [Heterobilharzia americana]
MGSLSINGKKQSAALRSKRQVFEGKSLNITKTFANDSLLNIVMDSNNVCLRISNLLHLGKSLGIPLIVTEQAHICILQTALHLLEENYKIFIVADACSSRSAVDMRIALKRLISAGAVITTTESLLFELIKTKDSPCFDLVRKMVQSHLPDHPALNNF